MEIKREIQRITKLIEDLKLDLELLEESVSDLFDELPESEKEGKDGIRYSKILDNIDEATEMLDDVIEIITENDDE